MTTSPNIREIADRVRAVAEGGTINGTYQAMPIAALDAFRADLLTLISARQSDKERVEALEKALRFGIEILDRFSGRLAEYNYPNAATGLSAAANKLRTALQGIKP